MTKANDLRLVIDLAGFEELEKKLATIGPVFAAAGRAAIPNVLLMGAAIAAAGSAYPGLVAELMDDTVRIRLETKYRKGTHG